jgi:CheY-like chemotaxis protein
MLFQAVRELLFNVVKHAFTRKVSLELTRTNDQIQVVVEDNGVGFDPKEIRGEQGYSGGFGLFSIRERISLLGGRMEIDSASGRGARFKLTIPVSPGTADSGWLSKTKIATPPVISLHHRLEILGAEGSIRIVVVDDHMIMRQGLAGLLRAETDFEIVGEASDGVSALNLIREIKPDVVLMDISMPGMSGIEATRLIHKEMPDIHIIGLSMFEEGDQAAAMREAGAADYLTKSGPAEKLISSIRAGFHRSQEAIQGRQDA